jgi:hypothetical protein
MDMNVHHLYVHVNSLIVADFGNSINGTRDGDVHKYINNYIKTQGIGEKIDGLIQRFFNKGHVLYLLAYYKTAQDSPVKSSTIIGGQVRDTPILRIPG